MTRGPPEVPAQPSHIIISRMGMMRRMMDVIDHHDNVNDGDDDDDDDQ